MEPRVCHLSLASMQVTSMKNKTTTAMAVASNNDRAQQQILKKNTIMKKATMKKSKVRETQKNANAKKEEGEEGAAQTWKCKKNDGKGWNCTLKASRPNSLCEYHMTKKRSYLKLKFALPVKEDKVTMAAPTIAYKSKPSSSSNAQKKKPVNNYDPAEGFYYYNGFGLSQ